MGILSFVDDLRDQILDSIYQVRLYKDKDKGLRCIAQVIQDNRRIRTYEGLLTEDRLVLFVPQLKRVFYRPVVYESGNTQVVYLPEYTHGNIDHNTIKAVAEAEKYDIMLKWKHARKFITTEVISCHGTLNFNLFDNNFSPAFSSDSAEVLKSKALSFLAEISNTRLLLSLAVSGLLGMIIGGTITMIILKFA